MTVGMDRHNPFNLEPNDIDWLGETAKTAPITFDNLPDGLRAGVKVFLAYQREGHTTVAEAIPIWAPPTENDTPTYIANVCDWCGVDKDQVLNFSDPAFMLEWAQAILRQEQGEEITATLAPLLPAAIQAASA